VLGQVLVDELGERELVVTAGAGLAARVRRRASGRRGRPLSVANPLRRTLGLAAAVAVAVGPQLLAVRAAALELEDLVCLALS
jgi:hypothetical protein